jgi:hypothetical protein
LPRSRWPSRPAPTPMIPFNAALVGAYWERLLVPPLEQRQVAGREPPSVRLSAGQRGYSGESQVHHLRHPAPIMATQPTDLLLTDIRATRSRSMDILDTPSPAMAIRATREPPLTPLLRAMDTQATQDSPPTPPRVTDRQATRDTPTPDPRPLRRQATRGSPLIPVLRAMDIRARRPILRTPVPGLPWLGIPAIDLLRTGDLGPSTRSSLLAEFGPTQSPRDVARAGGAVAE